MQKCSFCQLVLLLLGIAVLALTLEGCVDSLGGGSTKSCLDAADEAACQNMSGCVWSGCEGKDDYICTFGANSTTSCVCGTYLKANESCPADLNSTCTKEEHSVEGTPCDCNMCTYPSGSIFGGGEIVMGRMLSTDSGTPKTASVAALEVSTGRSAGCDWSHWPLDSAREVAETAPGAGGRDEYIADHYTRAGLAEHASVASFSRAALELMEHGAPAWLLDRTVAAAREEIRHAQMAFALARAWSNQPFQVTGMDGLLKEQDGGLAHLARRAVLEACAGETPAVLRAAVAKHFAEDAQIKEYHSVVLAEERRHAELAWATVAWALLTEARASGANPPGQRPAHLATQRALASTTVSLWAQANSSAPVDLESKEADRLLKVGILSQAMEAAVAQIAASMVESLSVVLLGEELLAGLDKFEASVHQRFEDALGAVNDLLRGVEEERQQLV